MKINETSNVVTERPLTRKEKVRKVIEDNGLSILRKLGFNDYAIVIIGRLEYWFEKYPDGFDKHAGKDRSDQNELDGDCWSEELPMCRDTFKKYFREIGLIHNSPEEYENARWKFRGKFYCSVLDRSNNCRTRYYRNHKLAQILEAVLRINKNSELALSE